MIPGGVFWRLRIGYNRKPRTSHSIQESLRIYLQPVENGDPQLDLCTINKRETVEYDAGCMQKYNEDANTTLIFVRSSFPSIFMHADYDPRPVYPPPSAPLSSSMFSPLEPDSGDLPPSGSSQPRSIRFSDGDPGAPSVWSTPLQEISVTLDPPCTNILGKQLLNSYLSHIGGSIIERCGERYLTASRNGRSDCSSRVSPPCSRVPFLLTCGCHAIRCRSTPPSPGSLFPSPLFYIGIVTAGAPSYERPFQTPTSTTSQFGFAGILPLGALPGGPW